MREILGASPNKTNKREKVCYEISKYKYPNGAII